MLGKNTHFKVKLLNLIGVLVILYIYQLNMDLWQTKQQVQESTIQAEQAKENLAQLESDLDELVAKYDDAKTVTAEEPTETYGWKDGIYQGTGTGFAGPITMEVTIEKGQITDIQMLDSGNDDDAYVNMAVSITDRMLEAQDWDVDTVSGATFSSNGIKDGVAEALSLAEEP